MKQVETKLIELLSSVVGVESEKIFCKKTFSEQGIGSTQLKVFAKAIERNFKITVPDLLLKCHSIQELLEHLSTFNISRDLTIDQENEFFFKLDFKQGLPDVLYYE